MQVYHNAVVCGVRLFLGRIMGPIRDWRLLATYHAGHRPLNRLFGRTVWFYEANVDLLETRGVPAPTT